MMKIKPWFLRSLTPNFTNDGSPCNPFLSKDIIKIVLSLITLDNYDLFKYVVNIQWFKLTHHNGFWGKPKNIFTEYMFTLSHVTYSNIAFSAHSMHIAYQERMVSALISRGYQLDKFFYVRNIKVQRKLLQKWKMIHYDTMLHKTHRRHFWDTPYHHTTS